MAGASVDAGVVLPRSAGPGGRSAKPPTAPIAPAPPIALISPTPPIPTIASPARIKPIASIVPLAPIAGSLAAVAAALLLVSPDARLLADPELARLLRGMALIKAAIVVPVLALLVWRLRSPMAPLRAGACVLAACAMSGATALIWQLGAIAPAALLFHLGAVALMLLAWRDDMPHPRPAIGSWRRARRALPASPPV